MKLCDLLENEFDWLKYMLYMKEIIYETKS